jgi:hypothetical protein
VSAWLSGNPLGEPSPRSKGSFNEPGGAAIGVTSVLSFLCAVSIDIQGLVEVSGLGLDLVVLSTPSFPPSPLPPSLPPSLLPSQRVMIRRLKSEVLTELPRKVRQRVRVEIGAGKQKELQACMQRLQAVKTATISALLGGTEGEGEGGAEEEDGLRGSSLDAARLLQEGCRLTGEAKVPGVQEWLGDWWEGSGGANGTAKILVFAHYRLVLDALESWVVRLTGKGGKGGGSGGGGPQYIRIDGRTPPPERALLVTRFQSDPRCRFAFLSLTAAGQGITLTAAEHVVFAELCWTPGVLLQAEDRAHRIGQTRSVNITYLVAGGGRGGGREVGGTDGLVWGVVGRKTRILGQTLDGQVGEGMGAVLVRGRREGGTGGKTGEEELQDFFAGEMEAVRDAWEEESERGERREGKSKRAFPRGDVRGFFVKPDVGRKHAGGGEEEGGRGKRGHGPPLQPRSLEGASSRARPSSGKKHEEVGKEGGTATRAVVVIDVDGEDGRKDPEEEGEKSTGRSRCGVVYVETALGSEGRVGDGGHSPRPEPRRAHMVDLEPLACPSAASSSPLAFPASASSSSPDPASTSLPCGSLQPSISTHTDPPVASSTRLASRPPRGPPSRQDLVWSCQACTFLNRFPPHPFPASLPRSPASLYLLRASGGVACGSEKGHSSLLCRMCATPAPTALAETLGREDAMSKEKKDEVESVGGIARHDGEGRQQEAEEEEEDGVLVVGQEEGRIRGMSRGQGTRQPTQRPPLQEEGGWNRGRRAGVSGSREEKKGEGRKREAPTGFGERAPRASVRFPRSRGGFREDGSGESAWERLKVRVGITDDRRGGEEGEAEGGRRGIGMSFAVSANTERVRVAYGPAGGGEGRRGAGTVNFSMEEFYALVDGQRLELVNTPFEGLGPLLELDGSEAAAATSPFSLCLQVLLGCEAFVQQWADLRGWERKLLAEAEQLQLPLAQSLRKEIGKIWCKGEGAVEGGTEGQGGERGEERKKPCFERYVKYPALGNGPSRTKVIPPYVPHAFAPRANVPTHASWAPAPTEKCPVPTNAETSTCNSASSGMETDSVRTAGNNGMEGIHISPHGAISPPGSTPASSIPLLCSFCKRSISDPSLLRDHTLRLSMAHHSQSFTSITTAGGRDRVDRIGSGPRQPYCSYACGQEILLRAGSSSLIRRQLFALERGVCQLCGCDCHALFQQVKSLPPPERVQLFMRLEHAFTCLDKAAITDPREGHFWQVDHVLPVVEGGGACGLENLRTLCTPCHARETTRLRMRLREGRNQEAAKGTRDIRCFARNAEGKKACGRL